MHEDAQTPAAQEAVVFDDVERHLAATAAVGRVAVRIDALAAAHGGACAATGAALSVRCTSERHCQGPNTSCRMRRNCSDRCRSARKFPEQLVKPWLHALEQLPFVQTAPPLAGAEHVVPQAPQLAVLDDVSTHVEPQATVPDGHALTHCPCEHD